MIGRVQADVAERIEVAVGALLHDAYEGVLCEYKIVVSSCRHIS